MIVCQECGNSAPSTDGFCSSCGVLLEWSGEPVATPPPPPPVVPPLLTQPASQLVQQPVAQLVPKLVGTVAGTSSVAVKPDQEAVRPAPVPLVADPGFDGLFCSACGTRNADGRTFCRYCGQPLDLDVGAPQRLRWWQRLFRRRGKETRAGDRPRAFRRRAASMGASTAKRRRFRLSKRLPLSRLAPLLVVLGLAGIGIGPGRQWLTQRVGALTGDAAHHVRASYAPVVPISATASSARAGHRAAAAIDGVKETWWQSADHPNGIGESVTVRFADPTNLDAVGLLSGVAGDKYRTQARPRTLTITADGKPVGSVTVKDQADFQTAKITMRHVTTVTVVVTAAFPGQAGKALAIRELQFFELE